MNYTYDTDSACGTTLYNGDLVKKVDAAVKRTCYAYDALHRVTAMTYSDSTPEKHYVYDAATVNGQTMQNPKGRLVEAYTGPSGGKLTDVGFSYSARGEVVDAYQSTPHSGGYYHVSASYWANGALNILSGLGSPTLPTLTYGVDPEGRPSTVSATSGQNPVTGTTYNVAGQATNVTFGSGDKDDFTYDPYTGRLTQYKYTVGATPQSVIGNLTWNPNGSLQQLQIADPLTPANAQTCKFGDPANSVVGYDDLGRLVKADCGSVWSQTFSFDPFGNINKTGTISFQPTYSSSTNRYTSIPGSSASYDANGNLTYDSFHSYTWDADGNPLTVDLTGLTYDALDRMVEQNRGGSYTQIAYAPTGDKLALMTGQALSMAFVPLPGGPMAVYSGGTAGGPPGYVYCVDEHEHCSFTGTLTVAYGANGSFVYQTLTDGTTCDNSVFGDPIVGTFKACYLPGPILAYYRNPDWLGSSRMATTPSRTLYSSKAYAPFGEPYAPSGRVDLSFTGQNNDTAVDVYDFLLREYHPTQGRWLSPDPAGAAAADASDPQSWSRYAYVGNSPLASIDPLGLKRYIPDERLVAIHNGLGMFGSGWQSFEFDLLEMTSGPQMYRCWGNDGCRAIPGVPAGLDYINLMMAISGIPDVTFPVLPPVVPQMPTLAAANNGTCQLVSPGGNYNPGPNAVALFQPQMANALTSAFNSLNSEGITPTINSGYRSSADQLRMRNGASGPNPAAVVSWHQVGMAVDINGTTSSYFATIISVMKAKGLTWGGGFTHPDPPHFQLAPPGTKPTAAMVSACAAAAGGDR